MLLIRGEYEIFLSIDGEPVDLNESNLEEINIIESVSDAVPSCKIILYEDLDRYDSFQVYDGAIIRLSYRSVRYSSTDEVTVSEFRIFQVDIEPDTNRDRITIYGYYNAPDYFKDSGFEFIEGTSQRVASEIARKSSLVSDTDISNDNQIWIRQGLTGYLFLQQVARSAYLDRDSAYAVAVTRKGILRYYNIGSRRDRPPLWRFISTDDQSDKPRDESDIVVNSYSTRLDSGLLNRFSAYGSLSREFDICSGNESDPQDLAVRRMKKSTDKIQLNRDLANPPRYVGSPFNVGNVHSNYSRARLQNVRILSTFSTNQRVMTSSVKDVNLLDRVSLRLHTTSSNRNRLREYMDGLYFVDRISTKIDYRTIMIGFNLTREGYNTSRETPGLL